MGSPRDFWPNFCAKYTPSVGDGGSGSLAVDVLSSLGLAYTGVAGGPLAYLDIKHMDAEQVIKLSLLEDGASTGSFKELIVNEEGLIEFMEIGGTSGLAGCDVYYQIQSSTYKEECTGVMVTGRKPLPERKVADFKDIWGNSKEIYNAFWVSDNGMSEIFSQYATIIFDDPQLTTQFEDGIVNLYDNITPWESIIGYARYIDWPESENSPDTTVERASTSTIPILVTGSENNGAYDAVLGTLSKRSTIGEEATAALAADGVEVPIPDSFRYTTVRGSILDKFIGIHSIVIVGRKVDSVVGIPNSDTSALLGEDAGIENTTIMVNVNSLKDSMYTLKAGDHYAIAYEDSKPYICFVSNARAHDPAEFGSGLDVVVDSDSAFFAGETLSNVSLLPTGGTDGFLVSQVIALVNIQTPCINIHDPRPGKALEIADELTYQLAALIYVEEPAPIAFNGMIIDQTAGIQDHDPSTQQNFIDTPYEEAIDKMAGGGLAVTLSFLDESGCINMSSTLHDYLNSGNGSVTTYICGPNSTPTLGGYAGDSASIVNDIVYSYSDSNSYTISVSTGPKILGGLTSIADGATMKTTENVPGTGKVIQDYGNHVHYKVAMDGCGLAPVMAINASPEVIRVGDIVQCTVHNNPIEQ